jgi:hypothetical protein
MTANIIDFKSATARRVSSARTERAEPSSETLSPTCKNSRLRKKRKDAWRKADAVTHYWRARLNLNTAISIVQLHDVPEGRDHHAATDDHWSLVQRFRKARVEQLLTPAPTLADVSWKKVQLAQGKHRYVDCADLRSALAGGEHVKSAEQLGRLIERAIADDEAFLASHPTRRPKRKAEAEA